MDPKAKASSLAKDDETEATSASITGNGDSKILQAIHTLREDLVKKIDDNADTHSKELRREIGQLRDELKAAVDQVSSRTKALEDQVEDLSAAANNHSDAVSNLEQDMQRLKKDFKAIADKNEDLEARSRRCNLRITGIKEKRETGKNPSDFMAELLQQTLGLEAPPLLYRSHCALRDRPQDDQPPRTFVVRCHHYREKEAILHKAAASDELLTPQGDRIRIFPDYTQATVKQRAAFREVKNILKNWEYCGTPRSLESQPLMADDTVFRIQRRPRTLL